MAPLLEVRDLAKVYDSDGRPLEVLRGVSLDLMAGDLLALVGKSGSGKSTFLHLCGTLDAPSRGRIAFDGRDLFSRTEAELARFRNTEIGFVFQSHHLLPEFSALENVLMPALVGQGGAARARQRATELLEAVGLADRRHHRPSQLSGGEQQRVAIARALVLEPRLLLADEPTGNLDDATGQEVLEVLLELNRTRGISAIVVTHSERLASRLPRRMRLRNGLLADEA